MVTDKDRELFISLSGLSHDCRMAERIRKGFAYTAEIEEIAAHREAAIAEHDAQLVKWLRELARKYENMMGLTRDGAVRRLGTIHDALLDKADAIEAKEPWK